MTRVAIPALVVMIVVASLLGAAGWNASAEPEQVITLTEWELSLPRVPRTADEDPGLQLSLQYQARYDPLESRNWLPETRLRQIGFSLHVPAGAPQAVYTYDHVPARVAWVVLEYDGPASRDIDRGRALQGELNSGLSRSRLVPVDAGADYERLRSRYPTGHLILRAVFGLSYVSPENGGPMVYGTLIETVPRQVAVPYRFRSLLNPLRERAINRQSEPRYEVEVAVGRLGLPYIRSLRLTAMAGGVRK